MTEEEIKKLERIDITAYRFNDSDKNYMVVDKAGETVGYIECTNDFWKDVIEK